MRDRRTMTGVLLFSFVLLVGWFVYKAEVSKVFRKSSQVEWVNKLPDKHSNRGIAHHVLESRVLDHRLGVSVYQPKTFSLNDEPLVIYFLHGRGGNEHSDVAGVLDVLLPQFEVLDLPEPLVIFPNGGASGYRAPYNQMFFDELMPEIEAFYLSEKAPFRRLIMGFSLGGSGAVRYVVEQPQVFSGVLSFAGGAHFADETFQTAAVDAVEDLHAHGFVAYFINGEQDRPGAFNELTNLWRERGIEAHQFTLPETGHAFGLYLERSEQLLNGFLRAALLN